MKREDFCGLVNRLSKLMQNCNSVKFKTLYDDVGLHVNFVWPVEYNLYGRS